jgi:oligopeptide/dipeptide ABC transporter ATP-binding protein
MIDGSLATNSLRHWVVSRNLNIFEVRDLSLTFGRQPTMFSKKIPVRALNNVSFDVREGQVLSVIGESGSGKTTLARCLTGLTRPDGGTIKFNNNEVTDLDGGGLKRYRQEVQMVFQDPYESLNPRHDVHTIISDPIRYLTGEKDRTRIRERVTTLLQEVGLDPSIVMNRYPHQLSGGERQRINIARAIATNPKVIVADEPITMLDAEQRINILTMLLKLKRERGITLIMITHDLASAKLVSNDTIVMFLGNIVERGTTETVLIQPHHPYVELIKDATPDLYMKRADDSEFTSTKEALITEIKNGCVFKPRCKYSTSVCGEIIPPLEEKSPGHFAACHNPLNRIGSKAESQARN